jgi:hypothetical protein
VEKKDDVAIVHDVVFSFGARFARFPRADAAFMRDDVVEGDDLRPDESFLEINVYPALQAQLLELSAQKRSRGKILIDGIVDSGKCYRLAKKNNKILPSETRRGAK